MRKLRIIRSGSSASLRTVGEVELLQTMRDEHEDERLSRSGR
jgi:hypothetical protein